MGAGGRVPGGRNIVRQFNEYISNDDSVRRLKKRYNRGVALALGAIVLTSLLFVACMFIVTSDFNFENAVVAGMAAVLMIACLIIAPIRLRRLQTVWLAVASDKAGDYVESIREKLINDKKKNDTADIG